MNNCIKKCLVAFLSICFACSTIGCQKEENPPVSESKEVLSEMTSSFSEVSSEEEASSNESLSSEASSVENSSSDVSSVDSSSEETGADNVVDPPENEDPPENIVPEN